MIPLNFKLRGIAMKPGALIFPIVISGALLLAAGAAKGEPASTEAIGGLKTGQVVTVQMPRARDAPPKSGRMEQRAPGGQDMTPGGQNMMMHGQKMMQRKGMAEAFYHWGSNFIIHKSLFDLTGDQDQRIASMMSQQERKIIQLRSEIQLAHVDLMDMIREDPLETEPIHEMFRKIADLSVDFKTESYQVYTGIMEALSEEQRQEVHRVLGEPLSRGWPMGMDMDTDS
jgi:hypothetical protein